MPRAGAQLHRVRPSSGVFGADAQGDHRDVVTTAREVSVEDAGDDGGMLREDARIAVEHPARRHAVRVEDEERATCRVLGDDAKLGELMTDDAVLRRQTVPAARLDERGSDVADG